jgi:hypothetical protein
LCVLGLDLTVFWSCREVLGADLAFCVFWDWISGSFGVAERSWERIWHFYCSGIGFHGLLELPRGPGSGFSILVVLGLDFIVFWSCREVLGADLAFRLFWDWISRSFGVAEGVTGGKQVVTGGKQVVTGGNRWETGGNRWQQVGNRWK